MSIHKEGRKLLFFLLIILFAVNAGLQYFISMELVLNLVISIIPDFQNFACIPAGGAELVVKD